jgi:nucleoside-diphosphate-sugar epimerase
VAFFFSSLLTIHSVFYKKEKQNLSTFILTFNMSASKEHVFVTAATGYIGSDVVRGLVKKGINTTAYVRDEKKAKDLFTDELKTGHLTITVGDYTTIDAYTKAIQGHTRLFLLVVAVDDKPTLMSQIKGTFGKIAFEQGVRQIVDLSSISVSKSGRTGIIAYAHTTAEEKLWTLADENPEQRSLVVLRPGGFMTNHLWADVHQIKHSNKLVSCGSPSAKRTWIDSKGK